MDTDAATVLEKLNETLLFVKQGQAQYAGVFCMELKAWEDTKTLLVEYGELSGDVDVSRAYTNEFLSR